MGVQTAFGMDKLSLLDSETKETTAEYESLRAMSSPGCSNVCSSDTWWKEVRLLTFHLWLYRTQLHKPNYYRGGKRNFTF